jgi:hypothetical protein
VQVYTGLSDMTLSCQEIPKIVMGSHDSAA